MLSPEVQAQADEIRRNKSLVKSLQAERDLWKSKAMDSQEKLDKLSSKDEMSDEDREEIKRQAAELDALNDELEGAAQENTKPEGDDGQEPVADGRIAPVGHPDAPTGAPPAKTADTVAMNGPANYPAGGSAPLMPTSAFDPSGGNAPPVGDASQPNQPKTIETAGGFVLGGGGGTARAPGSDPASPSSTLVAPMDPDAKGAASTADVVKSGFGDSSQNALLGNDGRPVGEGPGMVQEPSQATQEAAQKRADLVEDERARREANPLNLAQPGTAMAGSAQADAEALKRRQQEQWDAQEKERQRNDAEQGKPAPGTPGPDPVSGPAPTPAA